MLCILHCPLSGPDLIYISLLIIFCIIEYVTNKKNLEPWNAKAAFVCVCVCVFQTGDCLFELRGHTQQITAMTSYSIIRGRNTHAALITASSDRTLSVSFTQASAAVCVCVCLVSMLVLNSAAVVGSGFRKPSAEYIWSPVLSEGTVSDAACFSALFLFQCV